MGFQFVNSGYERVQQGLIAPDVFDQAVFRDIINHLMIHSFRKQLKNQTNYEQLTLPFSAKKKSTVCTPLMHVVFNYGLLFMNLV